MPCTRCGRWRWDQRHRRHSNYMAGVLIEYCTAEKGGGVMVDDRGVALLNPSGVQLAVVRACTATQFGGGISVDGALTAKSATILECVADRWGGGGLVVNAGGRLEVIDSTVSGCHSLDVESSIVGGIAGGIKADAGGRLVLSHSSIVACVAARRGGGLATIGLGVIEMTSTEIINCSAPAGSAIEVFNLGADTAVFGRLITIMPLCDADPPSMPSIVSSTAHPIALLGLTFITPNGCAAMPPDNVLVASGTQL
eukprot:6333217-Prymnesium_polylepis.1